ncbi:hypothetical protein EI94DRAFT_356558 [Lactarius quietus]|nr:hypothetical protein EI94DRAFT_356558 [Lactarius quietus]
MRAQGQVRGWDELPPLLAHSSPSTSAWPLASAFHHFFFGSVYIPGYKETKTGRSRVYFHKRVYTKCPPLWGNPIHDLVCIIGVQEWFLHPPITSHTYTGGGNPRKRRKRAGHLCQFCAFPLPPHHPGLSALRSWRALIPFCGRLFSDLPHRFGISFGYHELPQLSRRRHSIPSLPLPTLLSASLHLCIHL